MSPKQSFVPRIAAIAALGLGLFVGDAHGQQRSADVPFSPVHRLPAWYGARSVIDVEVVAAPGAGATADRPGPPRRVRFRVERAYVTGLSRDARPGNDLLSFGLDIPSGVPNALLVARLRGARSAEDTPRVPRLPLREQISRLLTLDLGSGELAESLADTERLLAVCRGAEVAPNLYDFDYWRAPECRPFPGDDRIARFVALHADWLIDLRCSAPEPGPPALACSLRVPFEGFAVRVAFHRRHFHRWSDRVDQAIGFLRSKQYRR